MDGHSLFKRGVSGAAHGNKTLDEPNWGFGLFERHPSYLIGDGINIRVPHEVCLVVRELLRVVALLERQVTY